MTYRVQRTDDGDYAIVGPGIRERCNHKEIAEWGCSLLNVGVAVGKTQAVPPEQPKWTAYDVAFSVYGFAAGVLVGAVIGGVLL